jgi:hypothetical protein
MVATCANRLVAASAGSSQQNHTLKAMVFRYLANGSDDQDEAIRNNLQTLLFHMTALEKEMSALNVYVLTQDMQGKPLNLWPKFEQLPSLAATSQELEDTIKRVKALVQAVSLQRHTGNRVTSTHDTLCYHRVSEFGLPIYTCS